MGVGGRYSRPLIFDQLNLQPAQRGGEANAGPAWGGGAASKPTQTTGEPEPGSSAGNSPFLPGHSYQEGLVFVGRAPLPVLG